jgi:hypothetical protein
VAEEEDDYEREHTRVHLESLVEHVDCEGASGRLCLESRSPYYCWSKSGVRLGGRVD